MPRFFSILSLATIVLFGINTPSIAAESGWGVSDHARARIISGVETIGGAYSFDAVLELEMAEGWHTYWKHPGDSGLPPRFIFEGSQNIRALDVSWPLPKRKREMDMFTVFTYSGKQVFPLKVKLEKSRTDTILNLDIQLMVCKDICIPEQIKLPLSLKTGEGEISANQDRIERARTKTPEIQDTEALKIDTVIAGPEALVVTAHGQTPLGQAEIFAYTEELAFTETPIVELDKDDPHRAMIKIPKPKEEADLTAFLSGKTLHMVLSDGTTSIEKEVKF